MKIKTQKTKILLGVACLIFLISSFPFVQALTTPIPNQLVVRLEDSQAVNNAIVNLEQNLPNLVVLDYDSAEYKLKYWRFLGVAIWVSHGSEEGVMINGELMQWDVLENPIKGTPNKDIVLSCYSNALVEQTDLSSASVATFSGEVDAVIGSLVVSYALSQDSNILPKIISRASEIAKNPSYAEPLKILLDPGDGGGSGGIIISDYVLGRLSEDEFAYHLISLMVLLLLVLVDFILPPGLPFVQSLATELIISSIVLVTTIIYLARGLITWEAAVPGLLVWFDDSIGIFYQFFLAAALWEQIVLGIAAVFALVALVIEVTADGLSGGAVTMGKILAGTASFVVICVDFYNDYNDIDTIVG